MTTRPINQAGLQLIESFEGIKLQPYLDSKKVPTIGIGCIYYPDGRRVSMSDSPITKQEAYDMLQYQLKDHEDSVCSFVKVPLSDNQYAALVSFCYNLGAGSLQHSTLLALLNKSDYTGAAEEFLKWNKAGGQVVAGLTRRRIAERALFLTN